jgi:hypothetical protein
VKGTHTLEGKILNLETFVRAAVARNNGGEGDQGVMDTREGHQVGLKFSQVDVESTIETKTGSDRADNLSNQTVQMLIARAGDIQIATADVVDRLIINEEGAVGVLDGTVGGENSVVRLNNSSRHAGRWVNRELQLGLFAVFGGEALQQQSTESRTSTATKGVEDQEALQR